MIIKKLKGTLKKICRDIKSRRLSLTPEQVSKNWEIFLKKAH